MKFPEAPLLVDSSSEDNEKDEAAASASSASESESRLEVDWAPVNMAPMRSLPTRVK